MNRFDGLNSKNNSTNSSANKYTDNKLQSATDKQQKLDRQQQQQEQKDNKRLNQQGDQGKQLSQQSQPQVQQQASPEMAKLKAKWQKHLGAAKVLWGKLTDDEILQSEGQVEKLSGLVKERYAITQQDADKQVKKFLTERNCC
tara:strand:- start:39 stop:467 length:429 start_codon:yes stop_codon:yes gene_type:complete